MDKNQAVIDYLNDCPAIQNNSLFFNFINAKDNNKQFVTVGNDKNVEQPYIDGSVLKRYTFTIIDYRSIAYQAIVKQPGYINENVEELLDVQSIIDWVTEQNDLRNYPDFGNDCIIESIQALTDNPNLNGVDTTVTPALAKYSISIRIEYLDNSKKIWN
jgi:hypothetical protein